MGEWKEMKLGELLHKITKGTTPPKGKGFVEKGINYIKSDAINYDGKIDPSLFVCIDKETHEKFKRSQLEKDDILFFNGWSFSREKRCSTGRTFASKYKSSPCYLTFKTGISHTSIR